APATGPIDEAAALLSTAQRPVIYAGQGIFYAQACDELRDLAETLCAPVLTTVEGKSTFPETHPLSLGAAAGTMPGTLQHFLSAADVVLAIGASLTRYPMHPPIPDGKRIIHAVADADDLYKDYRTDVPILGDAKLTMQALTAALADYRQCRGDARVSR